MTFDHILAARILFTLTTIGWAVLTVVADFNKTHATNPKWTPHARFHVVWQISSYVGFGVLAFALIWWPGPFAIERLYLVAVMGVIVYAAFFAALVAMPVYGGAAYDKNGYKPFLAPIPIIPRPGTPTSPLSRSRWCCWRRASRRSAHDPATSRPAICRPCICVMR